MINRGYYKGCAPPSSQRLCVPHLCTGAGYNASCHRIQLTTRPRAYHIAYQCRAQTVEGPCWLLAVGKGLASMDPSAPKMRPSQILGGWPTNIADTLGPERACSTKLAPSYWAMKLDVGDAVCWLHPLSACGDRAVSQTLVSTQT